MEDLVELEITVNGNLARELVEARILLVDFIRERLGLTGTHVGCDSSSCGACTVLLDGSPVKSCTVFTFQADRCELTTIEGLARAGSLHPVQAAFCEQDGLQCGYCTPGMIMIAIALLKQNPSPSEAEVRRGIAGNLCRCTGYDGIVKSILAAASGAQEDRDRDGR